MSGHPSALIRRLPVGVAIMLVCALGACSAPATPLSAPAAFAEITGTVVSTETAAPQPTATSPSTSVTTPTQTVVPASSNTPTAQPTPAPPTPPAPAATRAPTSQPGAPTVISFTVTPTTTLKVGDTVSIAWEAVGEKASLCFIDGAGPVGCQDAPLRGSTTLTVSEETLQHVQVGLKVEAGGTFTWSLAGLRFECPDKPWFFANDSGRCADKPAAHSRAAAQYFEHGFMVWTESPDRFYVFFDKDPATGWQEYIWYDAPYNFGSPVPPVSTLPPGVYAPSSGFGRIWRGELPGGSVDVQQRLGWATGPEFAFETDYQCAMPSHPQLWQCYLRGPDGSVLYLHPDSSAQVRFLWERQ